MDGSRGVEGRERGSSDDGSTAADRREWKSIYARWLDANASLTTRKRSRRRNPQRGQNIYRGLRSDQSPPGVVQ